MLTALLLLSFGCGTERWDVKTLKDAAGASVDLSKPKEATVADLRKLRAPKWGDNEPREETEKQAYFVTAWVLGYMQEGDEDFHIVLADDPKGTSGTMIAEIPAPDCVEGSPAKEKIDAARTAFASLVQNKPPGAKYRPLRQPLKVSLTGVAFPDKLHRQKGVAPNGVELHPVVAVAKAP